MRQFWILLVILSSTIHALADEPTVPNSARAFGYLKQVCDLGPRISGTEGMARQQDLLAKHFSLLGAKVGWQEWDWPHPVSGQPVRLKNMIVSWHPDSTDRVLLCCHYDTRPQPDEELFPSHRKAPFIGANDGGSGVAVLMELAHFLPKLPVKTGVDFVLFDAEELIFQKPGKFCVGSEYFATQYRDQPPAHRYQCGVLLDMVGDKDLQIAYETNSLQLAPTVTQSVWATAKKVGVKEFIPRKRYELTDDHLPLNRIAGIPTCDVIDFDYPHWHKRNDVPASCSGESLSKVAKVMLAWLQNPPTSSR